MMRQSRGEKIAERLGWILLQLYTGNSLSVNDISQQFSVSRRTGRRDLLRVETVTEVISPGKVRLAPLIRERVRQGIFK
ncbi:TPA: DeoR family transcriptional regulator [Enterobacter asburiae]|uniref:DeoR family transcriptional regulator n=2 Tax=Enterobacteriaceae TaxID=543 RepID=UPI0012D3C08F|nr:DeoR family transcriptional regulator [Enterobacter asburiae]